MTKKEEKRILMLTGVTEHDANKLIDMGAVIYPDFQENFGEYTRDWDLEPEELAELKAKVDAGQPIYDYDVVKDGDKTYYIQYCL